MSMSEILPSGLALVRFVVGAQGNMPLAAERASRKLGMKITEYMLRELISEDADATEQLARQLRAVHTISVFEMLDNVRIAVIESICDMSPRDLATMYATLSTSFATLTAPQSKVTFDVSLEAQKTASELNLDPSDVERELKEILAAKKQFRS